MTSSNNICCPHLYTLDHSITHKLLYSKSQYGVCGCCPSNQNSNELWLCLHQGCLAVLCGESAINHITEHNMQHPAHMLILNLNIFRVYCFICEMEVTQSVMQQLQLRIGEGSDAAATADTVAGAEEEDMEVGESASNCSPIPHSDGGEHDEEEEEDMDENEDGDSPRGTVGLRNLGLTCYMNAALQVLSNSPGLAMFFMECEGALGGIRKQPALAPLYRDLIREIWRRQPPNSVTPFHLYQTFKQLHPMFRSFSQQDSQEFLRYFLDELHDELRQPLLQPLAAHAVVAEQERRSSSSSDHSSDAEEDELLSANGSRSSLFEVTAAERNNNEDADSEEAPYETCDSGLSADELSGSPSAAIRRRRRRRRTMCSHSRPALDADGQRSHNKQMGVAQRRNTSNSGELCGILSDATRSSRSHSPAQHLKQQEQQQHISSCSSSPLRRPSSSAAYSSTRSLSPQLSHSSHHLSSHSPSRSPASYSPRHKSHHLSSHSPNRSPASSSPVCPSSPNSTSRATSSRTSGLGSSKPSLLSTQSYAGSTGSVNKNNSSQKKKMKKNRSSKGHRSKKNVQQQYSGSVVSDLFDGQLISSVQCRTCNNISSKRETFQDLSLPIPSTDQHPQQQQISSLGVGSRLVQWLLSWFWGPTVSLANCLNAFFSADELQGDNMYSCEKCGKLRNGVKFSKVVKLPEVLVIHLKRFRHDYTFSSKISQHVTFPLTGLSLQPFLHRDCVSDVRDYLLYGVICHHGSVGSGHYTAMALNPNSETWFEFDDECVTSINPASVPDCQAYVLFYKKTSQEAENVRSHARNLIKMSLHQPSLMRFYISKQWFNKFQSFAECGPIDNSDFLCPHGGVQPRKAQYVVTLVKVVRESVWEYLKTQYGGGPPCTRLYTCCKCTGELQALLHRQQTELQTFRILNSNTVRVFGVSLSWFRLWESFVLDRSQQHPPAIDNTYVMRQHQQQRASSPTMHQMCRTNPDYITITGDCWKFFESSYGGGPEFCLQPDYQPTPYQQQQQQRQERSHIQQQYAEQQKQHAEQQKQQQQFVEQRQHSHQEHQAQHLTHYDERPRQQHGGQSMSHVQHQQQEVLSVRSHARHQHSDDNHNSVEQETVREGKVSSCSASDDQDSGREELLKEERDNEIIPRQALVECQDDDDETSEPSVVQEPSTAASVLQQLSIESVPMDTDDADDVMDTADPPRNQSTSTEPSEHQQPSSERHQALTKPCDVQQNIEEQITLQEPPALKTENNNGHSIKPVLLCLSKNQPLETQQQHQNSESTVMAAKSSNNNNKSDGSGCSDQAPPHCVTRAMASKQITSCSPTEKQEEDDQLSQTTSVSNESSDVVIGAGTSSSSSSCSKNNTGGSSSSGSSNNRRQTGSKKKQRGQNKKKQRQSVSSSDEQPRVHR
uniref:ubiquitinyl hydrolase 1 n=2 Tax=Hirondellea gigas TaxID=1518452 RepID=A0A6A7FUQ5_9CRUS